MSSPVRRAPSRTSRRASPWWPARSSTRAGPSGGSGAVAPLAQPRRGQPVRAHAEITEGGPAAAHAAPLIGDDASVALPHRGDRGPVGNHLTEVADRIAQLGEGEAQPPQQPRQLALHRGDQIVEAEPPRLLIEVAEEPEEDEGLPDRRAPIPGRDDETRHLAGARTLTPRALVEQRQRVALQREAQGRIEHEPEGCHHL